MKNKEIENGLEGIGLLDELKSDMQDKVEELVVQVVQRDFPTIGSTDIHCPFFWECEKSPFSWCVYNIGKDPAEDHCLYCDEPYERK